MIEIVPNKIYANVSPSLFKTKKKAKYISTDPISGCKAIKNAGKKMTIKAFAWFFISLRLYCRSLINFAKARAVKAFANSEGCSPIPPKLYHEVAPLIFLPNTSTPANKTREKMYITLENCS